MEALDGHAEVTEGAHQPLQSRLVLDPPPEPGVTALGAEHFEPRQRGEDARTGTTGDGHLVGHAVSHAATLADPAGERLTPRG